jgi:hypothetical protein
LGIKKEFPRLSGVFNHVVKRFTQRLLQTQIVELSGGRACPDQYGSSMLEEQAIRNIPLKH